MEYYDHVWQFYLLMAGLISVLVFLIVKPFSIVLRSCLQALAMAILFVPVIVTVDGVETFAPMVAKVVIDLIAGSMIASEFSWPLALMLLVFVLLAAMFYAAFNFFRNEPEAEKKSD